jgi:hypothetical protein
MFSPELEHMFTEIEKLDDVFEKFFAAIAAVVFHAMFTIMDIVIGTFDN